MRNEWKFNLLEMIDREPISAIKMAVIVDNLEFYGKNPTDNYPYLYLLERAIKEVEKRDWLSRDEQLAKTFYYLKKGVINKTFLDEERDRKICQSGICGYFLELSGFNEMFEDFIQGVKRFKREW